MISEFNTFELNVNILQFLVVNQNVIFSNFFCSGLCDPFISLYARCGPHLTVQGLIKVWESALSYRNWFSSLSGWRPFLSRCGISMCLVSQRYELIIIIIMLFNDALDLCPDNKLKDPTLSFVKYNARTRRQWQHPRPWWTSSIPMVHLRSSWQTGAESSGTRSSTCWNLSLFTTDLYILGSYSLKLSLIWRTLGW